MAETADSNAWVHEGAPIDALEAMLQEPIVDTSVFHAVYARILSCPALANDPEVRALFDDILHNTGHPFDDALLRNGKICTTSFDDRCMAPNKNDDDAEEVRWIAKNIGLTKRLAHKTKTPTASWGNLLEQPA